MIQTVNEKKLQDINILQKKRTPTTYRNLQLSHKPITLTKKQIQHQTPKQAMHNGPPRHA
jgi:hypothetical protein